MDSDESWNMRVPLIVSGVALAIALGLSVYAWSVIPTGARVPIHWGVNGKVNGHGFKGTALFVMPAILVFTSIVFSSLSLLEPRWDSLRHSAKALNRIWISIVVFLVVTHGAIVRAALGHPMNVALVVNISLGAMFGVIGNYLGKVRSNFFVGVRTPWTLSSETSWNKTNRLAGRLLVLSGLAVIVSALALGPAKTYVVALLIIVPVCIVSVVYSYWVWRRDPNKRVAT